MLWRIGVVSGEEWVSGKWVERWLKLRDGKELGSREGEVCI